MVKPLQLLQASSSLRAILRCVLNLLLLSWTLTVAQIAQAQFGAVSVTPLNGTVGDNGLLYVSIVGRVQARQAFDSVNAVRVVEDGKTLAENFFYVGYDRFGNPINTPRNIGFGVNLAQGTHRLTLEAISENDSFTSEVFTVVVSPPPYNNASFVSHSLPAEMVAGQSYSVSVTMLNNGTKTWVPSEPNPYRLGAQNPQDNSNWGLGRVGLPTTVPPGSQATFNFTVTAPYNGGNIPFQWGMLQEGREWFGSFSPTVVVKVNIPQPSASFSNPTEGASYTAVNGTASVTFGGTGVPGNGASLSKVELLQGGTVFASSSSANIGGTKALAIGDHTIELRTTDSRGQTAQVYRTIKVVAPASASFLSPANGASFTANGSGANVVVNAAASPAAGSSISQMKLYVDGVHKSTSSAATLSATLMLVVGNHTVGVEAIDSNGVAGPQSFITITVVKPPAPSAAFANPTDGQSFTASGSTADVPVSATGTPANGASIVQMQLYVDGTLSKTVASATIGGTLALAVGTHTLGVETTDNFGTISARKNIAVQVIGPPSPASASFTSPSNNASFTVSGSSASVPIKAVAVPASGASISQMKLYVDGVLSTTSTSATLNTTLALAVGNHTLGIEAADNFGTTGPRNNISVNVVRPTAPTASFSYPVNGTVLTADNGSASVPITATAVPGTGASISQMRLYVDGSLSTSGTGGTLSATRTLSAGSHTLGVEAVDNAGSTSTRSTITIVVSAPSSATPIPVLLSVPHLQNGNAGTLPGSLTVGADGAATYGIALSLPPGSGGLQPNLSLSYSSNGSNGMVGLGWSFGGLSTIHRCPKTIAEEGFPGRISFDTADRLCLDGQKLVQANGIANQDASYWGADAQYRAELESFARISRLPNGGFKVEGKDGLIKYYGIDSRSAIRAQGRSDGQSLLWALARVEDRSGNYYTVEYNQDMTTGEYTPKQIRYGANSIANQTADLAVRFEYEARPDAQIQYMGGSRNDLRSRLIHVRTYTEVDASGNGGALARDYELHYVTSASSGRSMVDWVQVSARNPLTNVMEYLPKTSFTWGDAGPAQLVVGEPFKINVLYDGETRQIRTFNADIDGSGRTSIIVPWFNLTMPNSAVESFDGRLSGRKPDGLPLSIKLELPTTNKIYTDVIPGDLNGDGRDDLILIAGRNKQWAYCLAGVSVNNSPSFLPCVDASATLANKDLISMLTPPSIISLRNDGKAQVLWLAARTSVTACELVAGAMKCNVIPADINMPANQPVLGFTPIELSKQGMSDIYSMWRDNNTGYGTVVLCNYFASGFRCRNIAAGPGIEAQPAVGDLNGDSLTDFTYGLPALTRCLSTEAGIDCASRPLPNNVIGRQIFGGLIDPVGDGVTRTIFYNNSAYHMCRESAEGWVCQSVNLSGAAQSLDSGYMQPMHEAIFVDDSDLPAELSCDAMPDMPDYTSAPQWLRSCKIAQLKTSAIQDRIIAVVNGVDLREEVDYARGDDIGVYRRFAVIDGVETRPVYPQLVASAGVMVKQLRRDNGQGGWLKTDYHYEGAMRDAQGRGSLGFALVRSYDQQSGATTTSTFHQVFPYVGMSKTTRRSTSQCTLEELINTPAQQAFTMPNGGKTYFGFIASTSHGRRDLDCSDLGTVATSNEYTDGWGNLNVQTITTMGGGKTFTSKTTTTFMTTNGAVHQSGLPMSTVTAKTDPDTGLITRTVGYSHNPTTGLRDSETIEPGDTRYQTITTYDRSGNSFGLVNKVIQSWVDPACTTTGWPETVCVANKVRTVSDTTYDTKGRFPMTVKNALGQEFAQTFNGQSGARTSLTDVNKLTTRWTVDGFGRVLVELRPDGNETRSYLKLCAGDCPTEARTIQITEQFHGTDRIASPQITYADSAGRVRRIKTWGFAGEAIVTDQRFDSKGLLWEVDQPRFENATAYLGRRQIYDALDRVVNIVAPDEYGVLQTLTTTYQGLTISQTNARAQTRKETRDVLGRVRQVIDSNTKPGPGTTMFDYDSFDNLTKTVDPNRNVISVTYDKLGRRTDLNDPDLGLRHYDVNPLGQVYAETSPMHPAGTKSWMGYDLLGRMTARYEPELESHWVFDTAINGIGLLAEAYTGKSTSKDYRRTHTYDSFGRPLVITQMLTDANYVSQSSYDLWGRVTSQTYQRGADAAKTFSLRYNGNGYLAKLERGGLVLWAATAQDASLRPTKVVQGNGLTQTREFNRYTGRLESASLATSNQVSRLREGYVYDELGNVRQRTQYWDEGGFDEFFTYDSLNRLETSKIGATELFYTYDAAGNIVTKSGAGTYTYPPQGAGAVRPHAVQSISGISGTFIYDNNGNLLAGAGRGASWTSFDMPKQITKGTANSNFVYGPEHQRVRQVRSDNTTVIYAGAQEVEVKGTNRTVKTYWPLGIGVEIDRPAAPSELNWTQLDRLGSPVALTDAAGLIREKLEYDPWGKRRSTVDNITTPDTLDGKTDNRGFTNHEMLDQLDLVHMNGRVYDPMIGKFMSGDPIITDPTNGQRYNRYSYVLNNPTNLMDPTGFMEEGATTGQSSARPRTTLMGGGDWQTVYSSSESESGSSGTAGTRNETQSKIGSSSPTKSNSSPGGGGESANSGRSSLNNDPWRGDVQTFHEFGPNSAGTNLRRVKSPDYAEAEVGTMFQIAAVGATAGLPIEAGVTWAYRGYQAWRAGRAAKGVLEGANYAQKTYGPMFSKGGAFAGRSVDEVADALRSGTMKPPEVPIDFIVRDGNTLILNTRSAQALEAAGIPRSQWSAVNRTGQELYENMLSGQLQRNGLTSEGISTVRRSGGF